MEYGFDVKLYKAQEQFVKDATDTIERRKTGVFSSPTGTGKTMSLLCTALHQIQKSRRLSMESDDNLFDILNTSNANTIYYCSRTHTQLSQAVNELKRCKNKIRSVILGSRKVYCVNPEISKISEIEKLNKACKNAIRDEKCEYYKGQEPYTGKNIMDIEDLVNEGRSCGWCPYYYSRHRAEECDIVFLPYNLIFCREARESAGIDLENKIVIIDEAQNLYDAVVQLNSAEVRWSDVKAIEGMKGLSEDLREIIRRLLQFKSRVEGEAICGVGAFLDGSRLTNYNMLEIDDFITEQSLAQKNDFDVIFEFSKFLKLLTFSDENGRVVYDRHRVRFTTMDPSMYFHDLRKCRSVLLAGGTLEPVAPLQRIFGNLNYFVYPPITDNFLPIILSETVNRKKVHMVYTERERQIDDVVSTFVALSSSVTEGGVVIFVPSKYILNLIRESPKTCNFRRPVSFEGEITLEEFRSRPNILVAVLGGRLSEGINFGDEMCRLLVVLGVPYPKKCLEVDERMRADPEWGVNTAMSLVNQALGRAIRHCNDYAVLVLVDERYLGLRGKITPWIGRKIRSPGFVDCLKMMKEFLVSQQRCAAKH